MFLKGRYNDRLNLTIKFKPRLTLSEPLAPPKYLSVGLVKPGLTKRARSGPGLSVCSSNLAAA